MRKLIPMLFCGVAAVSFGAFAQTSTSDKADKSAVDTPAKVDRSGTGSPASGSTTAIDKSAPSSSAGASAAKRDSASTGASADTKSDKKKARKAKRAKSKDKDKDMKSDASRGASGAAETHRGETGAQAPNTSSATPKSMGSQGNPGPGGQPHAGSGSK